MFQRKINQAIFHSNASHNNPFDKIITTLQPKKEGEIFFCKEIDIWTCCYQEKLISLCVHKDNDLEDAYKIDVES